VETADVIVGGGGIIGLASALELARSGLRVRVLEKGQVMSEASWAAAGMLSPHDIDAELAQLAALSIALYPEFLRTVEALSGRAVPLRSRAAMVQTEGRSFRWLEEISLDPRDLCTALPLAAAAAGVYLEQGTEVTSVRSLPGSVEVTTRSRKLSGAAFVNCCGAWAGGVRYPELEQQPAAAVEPWKGQIFAVQLAAPLDLTYVLRSSEVYLVPRGGGRVIIGATVEQVGFDRRVDPAVIEGLRAKAAELFPPVALAPVVDSWSGLRPGTEDGLPLLGSAGLPGCWVATGHFRNGILLAPGTGLIVRQLLAGSAPAVSLDHFNPGRAEVRPQSVRLASK
jgi:glycine oxidase